MAHAPLRSPGSCLYDAPGDSGRHVDGVRVSNYARQLLHEHFADALAIIFVYPKAWKASISVIDYDGKRVAESYELIVGG